MKRLCVKLFLFPLLLSSFIFTQSLSITFSPVVSADWYYVSDSPSVAAEWYYFTNKATPAAKFVYFTNSPLEADVTITSDLNVNNDWIYISDSPSLAADWIYISDSPSMAAEWVYISNSPLGADYLIYSGDSQLKTPKVVACVLEYIKNSIEYHWDQFYNEYGNLIWRCRTDGGPNSGQFALDSKCATKPMIDIKWPGK